MESKFEQLIATVQGNLTELEAEVTSTAVGVLGDRSAQNVLASMVELTTRVLQQAELIQARMAGKIVEQCAPDLGVSSMSARFGHRKVPSFLAELTKSSFAEADRWVQNGRLFETRNKIVEAKQFGIPLSVDEQKTTAQLPILDALDEGRISPAQASEISKIIDKAPETLDISAQEEFTRELIETGETCEIGSLRKQGQTRLLDLVAVSPLEREEQLRSRRTIYFGARVDGLRAFSGLADPESEAFLKLVFDQSTDPVFIDKERNLEQGDSREQFIAKSPVRFRSSTEHQHFIATRANTTYRPLTPEEAGRRRFDRLMELIRLGIEADERSIYASQKPAVQVIITENDLNSETGEAWIEGIEVSVPKQAAERYICTNGIQITTMTGDGVPLNHGRVRRLFTAAQRQTLILRDGGCRWPGCDRPPSFCEAHHIVEWEQNGSTDLENGTMLCRKHHMELHNHRFRIVPRSPGQDVGEQFILHPPSGHPKFAGPVPMPTKARWLTPV